VVKRQPVLAINPGGSFEFYPSTKAVGRAGYDRRHVFQAAKGQRVRHRGRFWAYLPGDTALLRALSRAEFDRRIRDASAVAAAEAKG
jgi:hypothetical protein